MLQINASIVLYHNKKEQLAKAIESFFKSPIYGYGANGVLIKVFWSYWVGDGQGMNYMHNQILQILNDGGIILFAAFIYMLYIAMSTIDKLKGKKIRYQISTFIAIILIVMTFESIMEYFYLSARNLMAPVSYSI